MSAAACTAVGHHANSSGAAKALAESWNGTSWSVVPTPNPPPVGGSSYLNGVSCVSATACTAAGDYHTSGSPEMTLIESSN